MAVVIDGRVSVKPYKIEHILTIGFEVLQGCRTELLLILPDTSAYENVINDLILRINLLSISHVNRYIHF